MLTRICKTSFRFKVSTADRIFSTSNTRAHSTLETVVIRKKLAIRTWNLMQSPELINSFSQRYRNTPQKHNHHSCDTETGNKNTHRLIFSLDTYKSKNDLIYSSKKLQLCFLLELHSASIKASARGVPNVTCNRCCTQEKLCICQSEAIAAVEFHRINSRVISRESTGNKSHKSQTP